MKKSFYILTLFITVLFTNSCHKALSDIDSYFVKVTTVSAVPQSDGTLLITGTINDPGAAPVEYCGFCYSTSPTPKMLDNQLMGAISGNQFTATVPCSGFSVDSIYYFRTWANNEWGYSYGNTIRVDSIVSPPVTAPCSHAANSVNIGGSTGTFYYSSVTSPVNYMNTWEVDGTTSSGPDVTYVFGSSLTTGIYTTTISTSPGPGQVYVSFIDGFISGALNSGTSVYVNTIGPSTWRVEICNAPWLYNSTTNYFYTNMTVPH